jgi:hypothetical protein
VKLPQSLVMGGPAGGSYAVASSIPAVTCGYRLEEGWDERGGNR